MKFPRIIPDFFLNSTFSRDKIFPDTMDWKYFLILSLLLLSQAIVCLFYMRQENGSLVDTAVVVRSAARNGSISPSGSSRGRPCDLPWWECDNGRRPTVGRIANQNHTSHSHCSKRADALGKGQKVITYCFFDNYSEYASGFAETLEKIKQSYPGWVVRLYTQPQNFTRELQPLQERYPILYICDVANLPGSISDLRGVDPRLWRVAVLGDELVDVLVSRDVDSEMIDREVAATEEFLKSGKALHIMRDHWGHRFSILTGMFGVNQTASNISLLNSIRNELFTKRDEQVNDQTLLEMYLYPKLCSSMIAHDSYYCTKYPGTVPFPTRRLRGQFVGNRRYRTQHRKDSINKVCPDRCRPPEHQNWRLC